MTVPPDVRAAAAAVSVVARSEDALRELGGKLLWSTAETYYDLLAAAQTLARWVESLTSQNNSG